MIATACIVFIGSIGVLLHKKRADPTPVIGIPVYEAQTHPEPSQPADIITTVANQMIRALRNAGYTQKEGGEASITLVMQSSADDIKDMLAVLADPSDDEQRPDATWVVVQDKQMQILHLGRAVDFAWNAREGGPETIPEIVITTLA